MGTKTTEREGDPVFANDRLQKLDSVLARREFVLQDCRVPNTDLMKTIPVGKLTVNDLTVKFFMDPEHYLRGVGTIITDLMLDLRREGYLEAAKETLKKYENKEINSS